MSQLLDPSLVFSVLQWVVTICLALVVWTRKPGEEAGKSIAELRIEVARLLERQASQESVIVKMQIAQDKRIERLEDFFMARFGEGK